MTNKKGSKLTSKEISLIGLMTAALCIFGGVSVPIGPVPISFTNLVIYIFAIILGKKLALSSTALYLLIGFVGLPVFSGFSGGPAKLFGPTGGYLIGFLFVSYIIGVVSEKWNENNVVIFISMILSTVILYILGTLWLAYQANMDFSKALAAGVLPFIIGDLIKMVIGIVIGINIKRRIDITKLAK